MNGCLQNGVALKTEGLGYQSVLFSKQRFYGHASLIKFIQTLAKKSQSFWRFAAKKHENTKKQISFVLGVEDLSSQSGGRTFGTHNSHQNGLDADLLFMPLPSNLTKEERLNLHTVSMVDEVAQKLSEHWSKKQATLLKTAALFPEVDRIFVNPVIKQALCKMVWTDRSWLRKIRPWKGHKAHFHVRLRCPKNSLPLCHSQPPPPEGDGCGKELLAWFTPKTIPSSPKIVLASSNHSTPVSNSTMLVAQNENLKAQDITNPPSKLDARQADSPPPLIPPKSIQAKPQPLPPPDCEQLWASTGVLPETRRVEQNPEHPHSEGEHKVLESIPSIPDVQQTAQIQASTQGETAQELTRPPTEAPSSIDGTTSVSSGLDLTKS